MNLRPAGQVVLFLLCILLVGITAKLADQYSRAADALASMKLERDEARLEDNACPDTNCRQLHVTNHSGKNIRWNYTTLTSTLAVHEQHPSGTLTARGKPGSGGEVAFSQAMAEAARLARGKVPCDDELYLQRLAVEAGQSALKVLDQARKLEEIPAIPRLQFIGTLAPQ